MPPRTFPSLTFYYLRLIRYAFVVCRSWCTLFKIVVPVKQKGESALSGTGDDKIPNCVAGKLIQLNDNGAWSWFMDPRVIVDNGKLIVGSVRAIGAFHYRRSRSSLG